MFQDSVIFSLTLRENIAFSNTVDDASLEKALRTAELADFIATLPEGLDTVISERGTSLSGGQKQRIMLARALALNPQGPAARRFHRARRPAHRAPDSRQCPPQLSRA